MAHQSNWRFCFNCRGVFFGGDLLRGQCPASPGVSHLQLDNVKLRLEFFTQATPIFQSNWRWCQKCEGLFFHGNQTDGICPGGGRHDPRNSGNYQILLTGGAVFVSRFGLAEFLWCTKCEGMWMISASALASPADLGVCPAVGFHSSVGSGRYQIQSE